MGQPAPIPRRSSHLGSAACYRRSDHGSHSSTSAASSRSKRRQGNHNQFQTLKMFPDGHLGVWTVEAMEGGWIARVAAPIPAWEYGRSRGRFVSLLEGR